MNTDRGLPDDIIDTALRGDADRLRAIGRPDLVSAAHAATALRSAPGVPVRPSPALAALLERGAGPSTTVLRSWRLERPPRAGLRPALAGPGGFPLATKLAAAAALAVVSAGLAGTSGVLPAAVQTGFDSVVSTLTSLADPDGGGQGPAPAVRPEVTATDVPTPVPSADGTGPVDEVGAAGPTPSERAEPAPSGDGGRTASDTPAATHAPKPARTARGGSGGSTATHDSADDGGGSGSATRTRHTDDGRSGTSEREESDDDRSAKTSGDDGARDEADEQEHEDEPEDHTEEPEEHEDEPEEHEDEDHEDD